MKNNRYVTEAITLGVLFILVLIIATLLGLTPTLWSCYKNFTAMMKSTGLQLSNIFDTQTW